MNGYWKFCLPKDLKRKKREDEGGRRGEIEKRGNRYADFKSHLRKDDEKGRRGDGKSDYQ